MRLVIHSQLPRERDILLNVGVQPADRAEHPLREPFGIRLYLPGAPAANVVSKVDSPRASCRCT
jgi:hypothetical protein